MINICFIGPPASGKTTIAKMLADHHNLVYISAGRLARELAKTDPDVRDSLSKGNLADKKAMDRLLMNKVLEFNDKQAVVVWDGYPRYYAQLTDVCVASFHPVMFVIVECDDETIMERHAAREAKEFRGEPILHRLGVYRQETEPIVEWIKTRGVPYLVIDNNERATGDADLIDDVDKIYNACSVLLVRHQV